MKLLIPFLIRAERKKEKLIALNVYAAPGYRMVARIEGGKMLGPVRIPKYQGDAW